MKPILHRLNESYSCIDAEPELLKAMFEFLKVERPGAFFEPLVKAGMKSPYDFFGSIQNKKLLVLNGHLDLLKNFGVQQEPLISDYTEKELQDYLNNVRSTLPFKPYNFQEIAFKESILGVKQINKMCTGSGKSLTIALIADFFRVHNKKGLLLVPNINLLTQFKNDIKEYNLSELYDNTHVIGGGCTNKHFNKTLTISTWQSLQNWKDDLDILDYVICDESHRFTSEITGGIVKGTVKCKYKFGFTGSIPDNPIPKMELIGLFGLPKVYITANELIQRELGTPIIINPIILNHSSSDKKLFKSCGPYPKQLKFIKDHETRNELIVNLSTKIKETGTTLLLFQHTEHGKLLFIDIMKKLYPDVEVLNKHITGKKSFEFQEQYGVYFLNGEDNSETREKTRNILEKHSNALLIANYAILSTGVNIKRLHNMILASPMKSFTTITQSIGRLIRLHKDKKEANVYDLVDNFGIRKPGGIFYKQYQHRLKTSYNPEEYPVNERFIDLY